ncbi:MAG: hypothetical protein FWH01_02865 [Oscillospiraceae bacterium]|nr:hypothetical protein [Oscillospiraceae bacterium]
MIEWFGALSTYFAGLLGGGFAQFLQEAFAWLLRLETGGLLPGILVGAWTGYITNEMALRMIFQEFRVGPLGIGGVIPKTRKQFTQGVVDLVNEELIRPEVLREQIGTEAFAGAASRVLMDAAGRVLTFAGQYASMVEAIDDLENKGGSGSAGGAVGADGTVDAVGASSAGSAGYADSIGGSGNAADDIADWLAGSLCDTMSDDCGPLWEGLIRHVCASREAEGIAGRLIGSILESDEFATAYEAFISSLGGVRIKQILGERYFTDIKDKLNYAFSDVAVTLSVELAQETDAFASEAAYLLIDYRTLERFSGAVSGKTFADLLDLTDISKWDAFFKMRTNGDSGAGGANSLGSAFGGIDASGDSGTGGASGGSGGSGASGGSDADNAPDVMGALLASEALSGTRLGGLISSDAHGLDAALTGVYALATGSLREILDANRDELVAMMETSIEHSLTEFESSRPGIAAYARRAMFSGMADKHRLYDRMAAFATSWCARLSERHAAGDMLSQLLGRDISKLGIKNSDAINVGIRAAAVHGVGLLPGALLGISPSEAIDALDEGGRSDAAAAVSGVAAAAIRRALSADGSVRAKAKAAFSEWVDALGERTLDSLLTGHIAGHAARNASGHTAGHAAGHTAGHAAGHTVGHTVGYAAEQTVGHTAGHAAGRTAGAFLSRHMGSILGHLGGRLVSPGIGETGAGAHAAKKTVAMLSGRVHEKIKDALGKIDMNRAARATRERIDSISPTLKAGGAFTSLFDSLADRFEATIRDKVNETIRRKLDSYGDGELSSLARAFFGQLKHIAALGAIMGAAIGALSAGVILVPESLFGGGGAAGGAAVGGAIGVAVDSMAGGPPIGALLAIASFLLKIALFALIGWTTNIVALELLFRPRRELRLPGFTLQSVISRNKTRFAGAVGKFLASLSSGAKGVGGRPDDGAASQSALRLTDVLATQIYRAVPVAVKEYGSLPSALNAGKRLAPWLKSLAEDRAERMSGQITDGMLRAMEGYGGPRGDWIYIILEAALKAEINVGDLLAGANGRQDSQDRQNGQNGQDRQSGQGRQNRQSGQGGQDRQGGQNGHTCPLENALRDRLYDIDPIELRSLLRQAIIFAYEEFFQKNADKPVISSYDGLRNAIYRSIQQGTASTPIKYILGKPGAAQAIILHIVKVCRGAAPSICSFIRKKAIASLIAQSGGASERFAASVRGVTGPISSFAIRVTDSDAFIKGAAENFFSVQLPAFVDRHSVEIDAALGRLLRQLFNIMSNPAFSGRYLIIDTRALADVLCDTIQDERVATAAADVIAGPLAEVVGGTTFLEAAALFGIGYTDESGGFDEGGELDESSGLDEGGELDESSGLDEGGNMGVRDGARKFAARAEALVRAASDTLTEGARIEADDLARATASYCNAIIAAACKNMSVADLFGGVRRGDLAVLEEALRGATLPGGEAPSDETTLPGGSALSDESTLPDGSALFNRGAPFWVDVLAQGLERERDALRRLFAGTIKAIAGGDNEPDIAHAAAGFIERAAGRFGSVWHGGLARGASAALADAGAGALANGMDDILRAVDLRAVAEKQINAMDTGSIERVFRSFAGRYIKRLKLYGLWGGLFGAHGLLPLATALAALCGYIAKKLKGDRI